MNPVNPAAVVSAAVISSADLGQALVFRCPSRGNPALQTLLRELATGAGALNQALAGADGYRQDGSLCGQAGESHDVGQMSSLQKVVITASTASP